MTDVGTSAPGAIEPGSEEAILRVRDFEEAHAFARLVERGTARDQERILEMSTQTYRLLAEIREELRGLRKILESRAHKPPG